MSQNRSKHQNNLNRPKNLATINQKTKTTLETTKKLAQTPNNLKENPQNNQHAKQPSDKTKKTKQTHVFANYEAVPANMRRHL